MEFLAGIVTVFIIFLVLKLLIKSTKIISKLAWNGFIGLISLIIFNLLGELIGFKIELTFINALIAGVFGLPGIIILLLF